MTMQIVAARRALTSRAARGILRRCALAAIGVSFGAISISAFAVDPATGSSRSITVPSQVTRPDHRPTTVQPSALPDTKLDYLATHVRMVDQLYEELMHWAPPACLSASANASANASMAGGC
jgi:hypothetical protein